jgi:hypothetical protein
MSTECFIREEMSSEQTGDASSRSSLLPRSLLLTHQPLIVNLITHDNTVHAAQERITLGGEWGGNVCQCDTAVQYVHYTVQLQITRFRLIFKIRWQ